MKQSIINTIKNRIYGHGKGWCFCINDFIDLGSVETIKKSMQRLVKSGMIRRIASGIYEYPKTHKKLGILPPDIDSVARAIEAKFGVKLQPSGAYAANVLGLSEQVPAKVVFLTNGIYRKISIGEQEVVLKHSSAKNMLLAETKAGILVQALRYIGKQQIDKVMEQKITKILKQISEADKKKLIKYSPTWIITLLRRLEQ